MKCKHALLMFVYREGKEKKYVKGGSTVFITLQWLHNLLDGIVANDWSLLSKNELTYFYVGYSYKIV